MVVIGLGKNLLFKSVLGHCEKSIGFYIPKCETPQPVPIHTYTVVHFDLRHELDLSNGQTFLVQYVCQFLFCFILTF